jgi:hypothetical protein
MQSRFHSMDGAIILFTKYENMYFNRFLNVFSEF